MTCLAEALLHRPWARFLTLFIPLVPTLGIAASNPDWRDTPIQDQVNDLYDRPLLWIAERGVPHLLLTLDRTPGQVENIPISLAKPVGSPSILVPLARRYGTLCAAMRFLAHTPWLFPQNMTCETFAEKPKGDNCLLEPIPCVASGDLAFFLHNQLGLRTRNLPHHHALIFYLAAWKEFARFGGKSNHQILDAKKKGSIWADRLLRVGSINRYRSSVLDLPPPENEKMPAEFVRALGNESLLDDLTVARGRLAEHSWINEDTPMHLRDNFERLRMSAGEVIASHTVMGLPVPAAATEAVKFAETALPLFSPTAKFETPDFGCLDALGRLILK